MLIWSEPADWETCARDSGIAIDDMGAVRLAASHLITHGPGAFSTQHGEELFQHVQAQVSFTLGQTLPQWVDCYFFGREEQDNRWPLLVTVNGHTQAVERGTPLAGEFAWYHVRIPEAWLLPGQNSIRFACESPAAQAWILAVDTSVPNEHSRKSTDGGRSWSAMGLGLEGALCGEYVVRVRVWEHPAQGVLTSPVIDLEEARVFSNEHSAPNSMPQQGEPGGTDDQGRASATPPLGLEWRADVPPNSRIVLRYRSGGHSALEHSPWIDVNAAAPMPEGQMDSRFRGNDGIPHTEVLPVLGPFIQWQAELTPQNGCVSPALHSIALSSTRPSHDEPPKHAHTLPSSLCRLVPSYLFTHQDPTEPKLAVLREQERLDEIIAGGGTQWEQILALRAWVAVQWVHRAPHEFRRCCPWDALTILAWMRADRGHGQPQPDAYCTHYAVVMAQCALALGWPARLWVMSAEPTLHDNGHFVAEVWSTVHEKWVMLDADTDSHVDRAGVPQSVLEIHDAWRDGALDCLRVVAGANADKVKIGPDWIEEMLPLGLYRFCGLVLRNNHLSTLVPGPVEHGWTTYKWDGFLWWRDSNEPELAFFSLSSNRWADFDWEPEG